MNLSELGHHKSDSPFTYENKRNAVGPFTQITAITVDSEGIIGSSWTLQQGNTPLLRNTLATAFLAEASGTQRPLPCLVQKSSCILVTLTLLGQRPSSFEGLLTSHIALVL